MHVHANSASAGPEPPLDQKDGFTCHIKSRQFVTVSRAGGGGGGRGSKL